MNIHSSRPDEGGGPPLAPPEWTMAVEKNESGYFFCVVQCRGQAMCRLSLNTNFSSAEEAEAALAVRARAWIAEYLQRSNKSEARDGQ